MSDTDAYICTYKTKHTTRDEALKMAFRHIEHDMSEPMDITRNGKVILASNEIYNQFYLSDESFEPPTHVRARVIDKPTSKKPDLLDWIVTKLHGKPGHWS